MATLCNAALAIAIAASAGCAKSDTAVVRVTMPTPVAPQSVGPPLQRTAMLTTDAPVPSPPISLFVPVGVIPLPCATSLPIAVTTVSSRGSGAALCAAFNRSLALLPDTNNLAAAAIDIEVRLSKVIASPDISCQVDIAVWSGSIRLGSAPGSAGVIGGPSGLAVLDCIDAVVDDLMTHKIGPLITKRVASLAGRPSKRAGAGGVSTPAAPSPVFGPASAGSASGPAVPPDYLEP